jgi:hypothetical protein
MGKAARVPEDIDKHIVEIHRRDERLNAKAVMAEVHKLIGPERSKHNTWPGEVCVRKHIQSYERHREDSKTKCPDFVSVRLMQSPPFSSIMLSGDELNCLGRNCGRYLLCTGQVVMRSDASRGQNDKEMAAFLRKQATKLGLPGPSGYGSHRCHSCGKMIHVFKNRKMATHLDTSGKRCPCVAFEIVPRIDGSRVG